MKKDLVGSLNEESEKLVGELQQQPLIAALLSGSIERAQYELYLIQTVHYVTWTAPLLLRSAARLSASGRHRALAALLSQKAVEEQGHERWALADLASLGIAAEEALSTPPTSAVAGYTAWNRFQAELGSPLAILGTAFVLEHLSARQAGGVAQRLIAEGRIRGIAGAVRFLRGHGAADTAHLSDLSRALGRVRGCEEREAIWLSARLTRMFYRDLFSVPA